MAAHIIAVVPIIAGEVDLSLLKRLAARAKTFEVSETSKVYGAPGVALDVQGFVRVRVGDQLLFRPWAEMAEGLAQVTYLKVDRAEAEALTGETDLAVAAAEAGCLWAARNRTHPVVGRHGVRERADLLRAVHPALAGGPHRSRRYLLRDLSDQAPRLPRRRRLADGRAR